MESITVHYLKKKKNPNNNNNKNPQQQSLQTSIFLTSHPLDKFAVELKVDKKLQVPDRIYGRYDSRVDFLDHNTHFLIFSE